MSCYTKHGKASRAASVVAILAVFLLSACATTPDPVADAEVEALDVATVQAAPERHRGARVRWGGSIVAVENRRDSTVVEVLARPLRPSSAPSLDAMGEGRFRARFSGFMDPSEYSPGRWLTLVGAISGIERGTVGDYPYVFPLVDVEHHRLWRTREEIDPPPPPYPYYDPWWSPWYGPWYGPYPGWRHPHRR